MQNLRDKLLQAGLVDKKKKKQTEHQLRQQQTKLRKEGVEASELQAERQEKLRREMEERSRQHRELQRQLYEQKQQMARAKQAEQFAKEQQRRQDSQEAWNKIKARSLLEANLFLPQHPGPVRFNFVARSGGIRHLQVSTRIAHDLAAGLLAIGQLPCWGEEKFGLVRRDVAETLLQMDPALIRFFLPNKDEQLAALPPIVRDLRPRSLSPPRRWHFSPQQESSAGERRE